MRKFPRISLKIAFLLPILAGIVAAILSTAVFHISQSKRSLQEQLEGNLELEVQTIRYMFERERNLKLKETMTSLKVAHELFYSRTLRETGEMIPVTAVNQMSLEQEEIMIGSWTWGGQDLYLSTSFVDSVQKLVGGTVTVFQKTGPGYVRISTNVTREDGSRATGTYIPNDSPVIQTVESGNTYYGRAYVVNDWYITAYEPVVVDGRISGMLYVGEKEKDLEDLRKILYRLRIGKSGYPFVFDSEGTLIMHPVAEGENWKKYGHMREVLGMQEGLIHFKDPDTEKDMTMAFNYYENFNLYVAAVISPAEETKNLINKTILYSSSAGLVIIIIFSVFVYAITTDGIRNFVKQIEQSRQNLSSAREALRQSEDRFQTLFNSSTDDVFVTDLQGNIIEVNQAACQNLGYSRLEFQQMSMTDIKSARFRDQVAENRKEVIAQGKLTYESEHVPKTGPVFPVEMKSRLIEYMDEKFILIVARNISERKEVERRILTAVIQAEEKERERISKDMHDGLGPLLSTIKLYVNELGSEDLDTNEKNDYVKHTSDLVDEAIHTARSISNNLMPRIIQDYGLVTALDAFCKRINQASQVSIDFTAEGMMKEFDRNLELVLFRVVTELINNSLKHASANQINIVLSSGNGGLRLMFRDNGKGFDPKKVLSGDEPGMGLKNILSRIKSINGTVKIESQPGQGSSFLVEI